MLSVAPVVGAQSPASPADGSPRQAQARQQIAALEAAFENAVRQGTQMLNQRLQASNTDNMVMLAGLTRARGFRLDDYGVVFDVEFPSMRRSVVWSMRQLQQANAGGTVHADTEASSSIRPREIYQNEIAGALANAVLDYTGTLVGANEWLTVAARESILDRRFVPGDPNDAAITVVLRIKGSDLQGIRDGSLTRDDVRKRVEVKHY